MKSTRPGFQDAYCGYSNWGLKPRLFYEPRSFYENPLFEKPLESFETHVQEAMKDCNKGIRLRFINDLYRTKEVCLAAVKYEAYHNRYMPNDINYVPEGNIDYVVQEMEKIHGDDTHYMEMIKKVAARMHVEYEEKWLIPSRESVYAEFDGATELDQVLRYKYNLMMKGKAEKKILEKEAEKKRLEKERLEQERLEQDEETKKIAAKKMKMSLRRQKQKRRKMNSLATI